MEQTVNLISLVDAAVLVNRAKATIYKQAKRHDFKKQVVRVGDRRIIMISVSELLNYYDTVSYKKRKKKTKSVVKYTEGSDPVKVLGKDCFKAIKLIREGNTENQIVDILNVESNKIDFLKKYCNRIIEKRKMTLELGE